jgi:MFS family permease
VAIAPGQRTYVGRVAAAFLANGVASTVWLAATPELTERLGTSVGAFGIVFVGFAIGGILGTRVAPLAVRRWRSGPTTVAAGFTVAGVLALRGVPSSLWLFVLAQVAAGVADGVQDVAMNVEAVAVDRVARRPVVSRLHGVWSIGAVLGGLLGAALAAVDLGVPSHFAAGAAAVAAINALALPLATHHRAAAEPAAPRLRQWWRSRTLVLLAIMGVAASLLEGAPLDWGVLYLREELDASSGMAAAVTVAFTTGMVLSRLAGDHLVHRFGVPLVLRVGASAAALALAAALVVDRAGTAIGAWAVIGAGVAAAYPALFVAAGRAPGLPPGSGIGAVAAVARTGFLLGPALIGLVADRRDLRAALTIPIAAALVMVALAGAARRPAD